MNQNSLQAHNAQKLSEAVAKSLLTEWQRNAGHIVGGYTIEISVKPGHGEARIKWPPAETRIATQD